MDHAIFLMRIMFLGLVALLLVVEGGWCKDHVTIVNKMATATLQVHCRSRDNDLGVRLLVPNQVYVISFHHNIWGSTLYICDFNAPGHQTKSIHVYEGYLVWCIASFGALSALGLSPTPLSIAMASSTTPGDDDRSTC